jgi:P pilus assembly chaperone PapD
MKKTLKSVAQFGSLIASLALSQTAIAQLSVNRSVIEFTPDQLVQDIEVKNNGNFKLYLDLNAAEIVNPEDADPKRIELTDPRTAAVLVSPKQVLLPPGQRKRVRVILRESATDKDRVFRLSVKPYTGKVKLDNAGGDKKSSAIKVLVGYDLLLLSRPKNAAANLKVKRSNNSIVFSNKGNTNVLLRKIVQCDKNKTDCEEIQPNRLYAGETYKVELPKKGPASRYPVQVWQTVGLDNSTSDY